MDRGAWWATVWDPKESDKTEHFGVHDLGQMLILDLYLTLISGKAVIALHTSPNPKIRTVYKVSKVDMGEFPLCAFSSVQFSRSVVSDSLRPHELQHDSHPLSQ